MHRLWSFYFRLRTKNRRRFQSPAAANYTTASVFYVLLLGSGLFFVGSVFRKLRFLLGAEMTNDHVAFGNHLHRQLDRDLAVQTHRHGILTQTLQRFAQVDAVTI